MLYQLLCSSPTDGVLDQFRAGTEAQFLSDMESMGFDRLWAQAKADPHFACGKALAHKLKHLKLAIRQQA